jgi:YHS domain-containing protein
MKNTTKYLLMAACALGVAAFATKLTAANEAAPPTPAVTTMGSCCTSAMSLTRVADTADTNAIPDKLKTCPVSKEKLGGDMGDAYVFVYKGQQVKLCCRDCKKDFDKDPEKYMKLIRAADKKK